MLFPMPRRRPSAADISPATAGTAAKRPTVKAKLRTIPVLQLTQQFTAPLARNLGLQNYARLSSTNPERIYPILTTILPRTAPETISDAAPNTSERPTSRGVEASVF